MELKYQVIRSEQIDYKGNNYQSVIETHEDKDEAMSSCDDYNSNETNSHVHYFVRVISL